MFVRSVSGIKIQRVVSFGFAIAAAPILLY
jgi:hypothetical protein